MKAPPRPRGGGLPGQLAALRGQARMFLRAGHLQEACLIYRQALLLAPGQPALYLELGELLLRGGDREGTIALYRQALAQGCRTPAIFTSLGNLLFACDRPHEALAALRETARLLPGSAAAWYNLGAPLEATGDEGEAEAAYRRALLLAPDFPHAMFNLARLLLRQDRRAEFEPLVRRLLALAPGYTRAHLLLSWATRHRGHDQDILTMEELSRQPGLAAEQREHLGFALGKAYEELGDFDQAFVHFAEGNRLHRQANPYNPEAAAEIFARLRRLFTPEFFARFSTGGVRGTFRPLFIVGMPRSGTSLVEQILASHSQVYGAGELSELSQAISAALGPLAAEDFEDRLARLTPPALAGIGRDYFEMVCRRLPPGGRAREAITDKMPHNFLHLGLIKLIFPEARVIHCRRHPLDNCLSIFKNLFEKSHGYAYDLAELGSYYRSYHQLLAHWRSVLPGFLHELDYEELLASPEEEIRRLLAYCQLPWEDRCREFHLTRRSVGTLSANQVRNPLYRTSLGIWRRYGRHLEPLALALGDLAEGWGEEPGSR